jgi:hypothetical protein
MALHKDNGSAPHLSFLGDVGLIANAGHGSLGLLQEHIPKPLGRFFKPIQIAYSIINKWRTGLTRLPKEIFINDDNDRVSICLTELLTAGSRYTLPIRCIRPKFLLSTRPAGNG